MAEYIEREAVKEALLGWDYDPSDEDVEYAIDHIPDADVVPVQHGRWVQMKRYKSEFVCSECGNLWPDEKSTYCPECGAKMDLEVDDDTD